MSLPALVRTELTSFRDQDRTHLRDLIDLALVDHEWLATVPGELVPRLQELLQTPEG